MLSRNINQEKKLPWRGFFLALFLAFMVVIVGRLGLHPFSKILTPFVNSSSSHINVLDEVVKPKIERKKNTYKLNFQSKSALIPQTDASDELNYASSYALVDVESGDVILEKNLQKRLPIASLTKIMTAIVTLDLMDENEYITVSRKAAHQIPTKIGVIEGQQLSVKELLNAILLTSANDAAQTLHDGVNKKYKADVFVKAMNEKARYIGLTDTSFANPQGFDSATNFSTSHDLAVLAHYALQNYPQIAEIIKKDYDFLPGDSHHKQYDLYNWNGLIGVYPDTIGMKIGNTGKAGNTTVVLSARGGKKLLAVVLGTHSIYERDMAAASLLDEGYEKQLNLPPVNVSRGQLAEKYASWHY